MQFEQCGGEGFSAESWGGERAACDDFLPLLRAKIHDTKLQSDCGPRDPAMHPRTQTCVQKRSFRRAYAHAVKYGSTWYRGRCLVPADFPSHMQMPPDSPPSRPPKQVAPRAFAPKHRLQLGHVNVGGLSKEKLQEIQLWAVHSEIDVLLLSETRWSFLSDWKDQNWYFLHTGTTDRADGLLFLVRRRVCAPTQIKFLEVMSGRIGHLRIQFQHRAIDILGCYQFAQNGTSQRMAQRKVFWDSLHAYVHKIPNRNMMVVLGDFNCSLRAHAGTVGTSKFCWNNSLCSGPQHSDMDKLQDILTFYQLVAVNCWNAKHPPSFVNGLTASRIDHILLRHADVDGLALQVKHVPDAPFLPLAGAHHIPMLCAVPKVQHRRIRGCMPPVCTFAQRMHCRAAYQQNLEAWVGFQESFHQHFPNVIHQSPDDFQYIDHIHDTIMPTFQHFFHLNHNTMP